MCPRRRPRPWSGAPALLAAVLVAGAAAPGAAQGLVVLEKELPPMLVRACPSLEAAKAEAARAKELASRPASAGVMTVERTPGCHTLVLTVMPLLEEPEIPAVKTWAITYDPAGRELRPKGAPGHPAVRTSMKLQTVRYYRASFRAAKGPRHVGWVELPDEPYLVRYLQDRKR